MKKLAFVIYDKFEELEAVAPIDILRRAGADVKVLTLNSALETRGRSSIEIRADARLRDCESETFDCVAVSGGPGYKEALESESLLKFVRRHAVSDKLIAAICAAPLILKKAGVLEGKRCTSHPSVFEQMGALALKKPLVQDGNVLTSNGAGNAVAFGLKIAEVLISKSEAEKVSNAICFGE